MNENWKIQEQATDQAVDLQTHVRPPIKKCCWCGIIKNPKKRGIGKSCMLSAPGVGKRYYWNCGCLDSYNFHEFTELLFGEDKDYPDKFKKAA